MSYLASWRLALAADVLVSSDATVAAIARREVEAPRGLGCVTGRPTGT